MSRYHAPEGGEATHAESPSEKEYDENADEDFNPDKAAEEADPSSSSEDNEEQQAQPGKKARKRKRDVTGEELDSGDEATIKERRGKKRKKDAGGDEDSGGEGGLVRTRAQRVAEREERKHRKRAREGKVTIDVDQLWDEMRRVPVGRSTGLLPRLETDANAVDGEETEKQEKPAVGSQEEMVTIIKRTEYAGIVESGTETVPRSSKEAQDYFAAHPEADPSRPMHSNNSSGLQKPMKRPSMFEPNPIGLVKGVAPEKLRLRAPSRKDVEMAEKRREAKGKVTKMTTVQKSHSDWKTKVEEEGWQDELNEYSKSKRGFLAREAFLDRAAGARAQAARDARLKL